jgi:hypothetical protein
MIHRLVFRSIFFFVLACVLGIATHARAVPITAPGGLNAGDVYRLAFVSSTLRDASSTNIADYNAYVTALANAVPELLALGTTWTAIGSTASVDARDNTATNPTVETGVPIYRLNGNLLATNYADLWDGSIALPLIIDETGAGQSGVANVWTGTTTSGIAHATRPLGSTGALSGDMTNAAANWIALGAAGLSTQLFRVYAISGPITYEVVPEPSTAALLALGLTAMVAVRRRS